ncbi:MAG: methyltransferase, TrmH family [Pyrinomonadaceae bacterium]|jgi:TrmH family RNA methyltransferase|nr:methyltransferase, TrmH family [Pyrinomonadaceae bacterium]
MITSRHNPLIQHARAVGKGASKESLFIEGLRLCEEAARSRLACEEVFYTEKFAGDARHARLLDDLKQSEPRFMLVSETVLASLGDTKTPQGIVLLARRFETDRATFEKSLRPDPLVVVLHRINNPANAGAMLRVAEAASASGVVATVGTTDLLSPKALRGAMGSSFRLPLWTNAEFAEVVAWCGERGIRTVSADLAATHAHTELVWTGARAVLMGAEAGGLDAAETRAADERVRIPMQPPVESLNVAVALAVILYEAARQRAQPESHG